MRSLIFVVCSAFVLAGCGGGSGTTPNPDSLVQVTGIRPSQGLDASTPGYSGDELSIQALITGEVPTSIIWDFGGGAIPVSLDDPDMPTVELGAPGNYTGRVTVTDSAGHTDSFEFEFTILPESHRIKSISPASPAGIVTETLRFNLQVDGVVESAVWNFQSGTDVPTVTGIAPVVQVTQAGTHEVDVTVSFVQGPTVTRTFSFEVGANAWTQVHEQDRRWVVDSLALSTGDVALLNFRADDDQLELLRVPASALTDPGAWQRHDVGLSGATESAVLREHGGRMGLLYRVHTGGGGGGYGGGIDADRTFFALSDSLHPVTSENWAIQEVGSFNSTRTIALAPGIGDGWEVIVADRDLHWLRTSATAPTSPAEWEEGVIEENVSPNGLALAQTGESLICVISPNNTSETILVRTTSAQTVAGLEAASAYPLPGLRATVQSEAGIVAAMLESGSEDMEIAVNRVATPVQISDWRIRPVQSGVALGSASMALVDGTILLLYPEAIERDDKLFRSLVMRQFAAEDLDGPTERVFVTGHETWQSPYFVAPVPDGGLLGYQVFHSPVQRFLTRSK